MMKSSPDQQSDARETRPPWARYLAKARKDAGLTQAKLAEALGTSQSTVGSWERGQNEPDLTTLAKIGHILNVSPAALAFPEEKGQPEPTGEFEPLALPMRIVGSKMLNQVDSKKALTSAWIIVRLHKTFEESGIWDVLESQPAASTYRRKMQELFLALGARIFDAITAAPPEEQEAVTQSELTRARNILVHLYSDLDQVIAQQKT